MAKSIWRILGIISTIIALILLFLVILIPILKSDQLEEDCSDKYIPKKDNTNLWASFPGQLKSSTKHVLNVFDYSKGLNNVTVKETVNLEEKTKYDNFVFDGKKIYFDAKSEYELQNKKEKNEVVNNLNLGLFEGYETLTNPPLYQKGINAIQYLLKKGFQSPQMFTKHLFSYTFFNSFIKYEDKVLQTILKDIDEEKAQKILSDDPKYAQYSFKTIFGFYQWVKILGNSNEINEAKWLIELFELTNEEINSIFGEEEYLYKEYMAFSKLLAKKFNCKNEICGNELIYKQLLSGENLTNITDGNINCVLSLYKEINKDLFPFPKSPELFVYFEEYKNKTGEKEYTITVDQLQNLLDQKSENSLFSPENSILFLTLFQTNNEEQLSKLFKLSLKESKFLYNYFYEFLPKFFLYPDFEHDGKTFTVNPVSKTFSVLTQKILENTYYKLLSTYDFYNFLLSKYVWRSLHYKLLNLSMEYDDEDICPLIMQHALDDGRKVLTICSDPVTAFKTPYELSKWFEPYYCLKGEKKNCDMRIIEHLKSIVYITEDEIKDIYDLDNLGQFIEEGEKDFRTAFNCGDKCTSEYLVKIQFWESYVSKNMPPGFDRADSLNSLFPKDYPYPMELYYYTKNLKIPDKISENELNLLISLSPKRGNCLLEEEDYEAFKNKLILERNHTLFMEGKMNVTNYLNYTMIYNLNQLLLFNTALNSKYNNVDDLLQGNNNEDKKYLEFLSNGKFYDNFKPGLNKTTGFNFGLNLTSGEKKNIEYDRYCINTEEGKNMRKIISINDFPVLNIKKLEYNHLTNNFSYINSPILNFQTLTGEKSFIDGFQYDHEQDTIYYYDKVSSRPYKFSFSEEVDYEDQTCRKYTLNKNDIVNNMNEKDDLKSNKAFISQKLNKPLVVSVGKVENVNISEKIKEDNYICVEPYSNMVLDSNINFVYSIYTKNYGFLNPNIQNEKLYPIFSYNRIYKVNIDSFNDVFSLINSYKSFRKAFIIALIILILIFAAIAGFCFYKYYFYKRHSTIKLDELSANESKDKLINDRREPTLNKTLD